MLLFQCQFARAQRRHVHIFVCLLSFIGLFAVHLFPSDWCLWCPHLHLWAQQGVTADEMYWENRTHSRTCSHGQIFLYLLCRDRGGQAVGLRVQGGTCLTEMRWIFVWFLEKALVMCPDTPRTNNKLAGQVVQILLPHYSIPKLQKASLGKEFSFGSSVWS